MDRGKLAVLVQCLGEISPLNRKGIPRLLTAFLGLLAELNREVNERRNPNSDRSQLAMAVTISQFIQICSLLE